MKNLKIWSLALALLVAVTGCKPAEDTAETVPFNPIASAQLAEKLQSAWQLVEYAGQPASFDIFIEFQADGNFELYQRLYSSDYEKLAGTYTLEGGVLTGVYSNGADWNNDYTVQIAEKPLRLRLIEKNGTYAEYIAIDEVPANIKAQAVVADATRAAEYFL